MTKRITAISFIFVCTALAWAVLGGTIFSRTYNQGPIGQNSVASTWGSEQKQGPPSALFTSKISKQLETIESGKKVMKKVEVEVITNLPLESSSLNVALDLQHRQKGLLWYSTYKVNFDGKYGFRNTSDSEQTVEFKLPFPTTQAIYDDLTFYVDNTPVAITNEKNAVLGTFKVGGGKTAELHVGYRSQGLNGVTALVEPMSIRCVISVCG